MAYGVLYFITKCIGRYCGVDDTLQLCIFIVFMLLDSYNDILNLSNNTTLKIISSLAKSCVDNEIIFLTVFVFACREGDKIAMVDCL